MLAKEQVVQEELSFCQGDIVLAKCPRSVPQPATVESFRGFDEEGHEIYKVKFILGQQWAYLQHYRIRHLSLSHIKEFSKDFDSDKQLQGALKAQSLIKKLGDKLAGNCRKRFEKIYLSEQPFDKTFLEEKKPRLKKGERASNAIQSARAGQFRKRSNKKQEQVSQKTKAFERCKFVPYMNLIINIYHVDEITLKIEIELNDFISGYEQQAELPEGHQKEAKLNESITTASFKDVSIEEFAASENTAVNKKENLENMEKPIGNQEFSNIQDGLIYSLGQVLQYLSHLQKSQNFEIHEPFEILENIDLGERQNDVKQYLNALLGYDLTARQIERTLTNIKQYVYDFVQTYSIHFLFRNISTIRDLSKQTGTFEKVPIIGLFQFIDISLCIWLDQIEQQLSLQKFSKIKGSNLQQPTSAERVNILIVGIRQSYSTAIAPLKQLLQTWNT